MLRELALPGISLVAMGVALAGSRFTRAAWMDGFRCVQRHPVLVVLPAAIALLATAFPEVAFQLVGWRMTGEWRLPASASLVWSYRDASFGAGEGMVSALEGASAVFTGFVAAFPLSAFYAVAGLFWWGGRHGAVRRVLTRRFRAVGWFTYLVLLVSAVAGIGKFCWYVFLPDLHQMYGGTVLFIFGIWLNAAAFPFEVFVTMALQAFLIWTAVRWVRGGGAASYVDRLAVRSAAGSLPWTGWATVVMWILLHGPLLLAAMTGWVSEADATTLVQGVLQPVLSVLFLLFFAVPTILMLRKMSGRRAVGRQRSLVRVHGVSIAAFLLSVVAAFVLVLTMVRLGGGFAENSWASWFAGIVGPSVLAGVSGGMLAAWVCLYRHCVTGRREAGF